jgi:predicted DNA-binding mobile mystery protein A
MNPKNKHIVRQQLDKTLSLFGFSRNMQPPVKGWIRAVREALGMSGTQLAKRLKVSQPRIPKLEQDELSGAVTLKTMRQAAEALDCVFVYALVPRTSLEDTVRTQARKIAAERMQRVSHTMLLEAQGLSEDEQRASVDAAIEELVRELPKELWETKP